MRHPTILAILLLIPSLAHAEKPARAVFEAGIFIPAADRRFNDADRKAIAKQYPDMAILTGDPPDQPPAQFMVLQQPTIKEVGSPQASSLRYRGRGLSPEQAQALVNAKSVWMVVFVGPADKPLENVRRGDQMLATMAELTGGIIYDSSARQYCSPEWWKSNRLDTWQGGIPDVSHFITIDIYRNPTLLRAVSMGMEKFSQPNLVIDDLTQHDGKAAASLMNVVLQRVVEGQPVTPANGRKPAVVPIDLDAIKHETVRKSMIDSLLDKATKKLDVAIGPAERDEGDPEGVLYELTFANIPGGTPQERHNAALSRLFGSRDEVAAIKHDDELLAASRRAKGKLPEIRKRFNAGLPVGQHLIVKGPFKTTAGGHEWMWVEVTAWPDGQIEGILVSEPVDVPALQAGAKVTVKEADVFDYLLRDGTGILEGGETVKIMTKRPN